jgi:uncharacterized protein (DUF427 family)
MSLVMSSPANREQVTLSRETIHNPDEPRHFMRIKPVPGLVRILYKGRVLAESSRALRLLEAGKDIYDPTIYLPASDVRAALSPGEKRTYCPLKGHATYFDLLSENGRVEAAEIAWSYQETLDIAAELKDLVAFYASQVVVEEHPLPAAAAAAAQ